MTACGNNEDKTSEEKGKEKEQTGSGEVTLDFAISDSNQEPGLR